MADDLRAIATELYAVPLAEFVSRRTEQAKDTADKELARQVKALRKPNAAAWAVNALARERADLVEEMLDLGDELRDAQSDGDGTRLRLLDRTRRELSASAVRQAASLAEDAGGHLSAAAASAVEETLLAAMTDPDAGAAVREGLLVDSFTASPFEPVDLSGVVALTPEGSRKRAKPAKRPRRRQQQPAKKTVAKAAPTKGPSETQRRHRAEAEADLDEAERAARSAAEEADERAADQERVEEELQNLRNQAARIDTQITHAERALKATRTHARNAKNAAEASRGKRDKAQQRLDRLDG